MEKCRDSPKVTVRAVAQLGINFISQDCRKIHDRRDIRRSSVILKSICYLGTWLLFANHLNPLDFG